MTQDWWRVDRIKYDIYISDVVLLEIEQGDTDYALQRRHVLSGIPLLKTDEGVRNLAERYMEHFSFPDKLLRDSFHIAYATYYGMDFLLSWNFSHLVNAHMRQQYGRFSRKLGFEPPEICSPEEWRDLDIEEV